MAKKVVPVSEVTAPVLSRYEALAINASDFSTPCIPGVPNYGVTYFKLFPKRDESQNFVAALAWTLSKKLGNVVGRVIIPDDVAENPSFYLRVHSQYDVVQADGTKKRYGHMGITVPGAEPVKESAQSRNLYNEQAIVVCPKLDADAGRGLTEKAACTTRTQIHLAWVADSVSAAVRSGELSLISEELKARAASTGTLSNPVVEEAVAVSA